MGYGLAWRMMGGWWQAGTLPPHRSRSRVNPKALFVGVVGGVGWSVGERAGQWQWGLQVLQYIAELRLKRDIVSYNAAIPCFVL